MHSWRSLSRPVLCRCQVQGAEERGEGRGERGEGRKQSCKHQVLIRSTGGGTDWGQALWATFLNCFPSPLALRHSTQRLLWSQCLSPSSLQLRGSNTFRKLGNHSVLPLRLMARNSALLWRYVVWKWRGGREGEERKERRAEWGGSTRGASLNVYVDATIAREQEASSTLRASGHTCGHPHYEEDKGEPMLRARDHSFLQLTSWCQAPEVRQGTRRKREQIHNTTSPPTLSPKYYSAHLLNFI